MKRIIKIVGVLFLVITTSQIFSQGGQFPIVPPSPKAQILSNNQYTKSIWGLAWSYIGIKYSGNYNLMTGPLNKQADAITELFSHKGLDKVILKTSVDKSSLKRRDGTIKAVNFRKVLRLYKKHDKDFKNKNIQQIGIETELTDWVL